MNQTSHDGVRISFEVRDGEVFVRGKVMIARAELAAHRHIAIVQELRSAGEGVVAFEELVRIHLREPDERRVSQMRENPLVAVVSDLDRTVGRMQDRLLLLSRYMRGQESEGDRQQLRSNGLELIG